MPQGNCSLCGVLCDLTFDHVPPRATFNKTTRYQEVPGLDLLKSPNPLEYKFKGKTEQGGVGYYSLCKNCNSFLGTQYVNSYIKYSNAFIESAKKEQFNYFEFEMHQFKAARVLKQTAAMFISLNGWDFTETYHELRNYVLNVNSQNLPNRFRFFIYLKTEGNLRNLRIGAKGNLETGTTIVASELAYPPLGHVMTIDFTGELPYHFEITNFKEYGVDDMPTIIFKVKRLPTHLPFLLDYRPKSAITETINKNSGL